MLALISIIIPTKNEEENIVRCLSSITKNGYSNYETIVVDQSSKDRTVEFAKQFKAQVIIVPPTEKYIPPSQSRNLGFTNSHGQIIYHLDADMELEPGLLAEIAQLLKQPENAALVVPEIDIPTNYWARGKAFERSLYKNSEMEAARVTTKKNFSRVGYDSEITSGEDWYIHDRYKEFGQIIRTTKTVRHHIGSISLIREFKKKLHYGTDSSNYLKRKPTQVSGKLIELLSIYFKGVAKNILRSPLDVLAFLIIRLVDTIALTLGLLTAKTK